MSYESLSHSKWECKYHLIFVPKYRKKVLYGKIRQYLGPVFHELAKQKDCKILEGHMVQDHVHMLISIPPKYAVSQIVGYIKGKSAIAVARQFSGRKRNFNGESFWARGYAVSTVGYEELKIREYIKNQEQLDSISGADEKGNF
ncbi:MAG: IS200/IS605 family transposase [Rickettsiaceae bacterium]|nr:IS200/IS605 family transposase [Rickettsiaceae bacterium]